MMFDIPFTLHSVHNNSGLEDPIHSSVLHMTSLIIHVIIDILLFLPVALADEQGIAGNEVYGFKTPKKSGQMVKKGTY